MKIAIIGGGASGIMAGIQAAMKGANVTIYEKNDRIGKKLLATGNGKCNFTNLFMDESCYYSGRVSKVMNYIKEFDELACQEFFVSLGMLIKDRNGYLYPASEQAGTLLDLLRLKLAALGVELITEITIVNLEKQESINHKVEFSITGEKDGKRIKYQADKVIVSMGSGAGIPKGKYKEGALVLKNFSLDSKPRVPGLVALRVVEDYMKIVAGVRLEGQMTLYIDRKEVRKELGEIQLTEYGVSGIPTFQLSRFAAYGLLEKKSVQVSINSLPNFTQQEFFQYIDQREVMYKEETAEEFLIGIANKKINQLFLKLSGIRGQDRWQLISEEKKNSLLDLYHNWELTLAGTNPMEMAQVLAGGITMDSIGTGMEVLAVPGLYITGEMLDVDGRCGGYNLQWAFTSGYLAGQHAPQREEGNINDKN